MRVLSDPRIRFWSVTVGALSAAFWVLLQSPQSTVLGQDGGSQEAEERGLRQLIIETREVMAQSKWIEAAEKFEAAWKASCEAGDPLMLTTGADVRQLSPGQTEEMAGGKAQLERLYFDAPDAFREAHREQYAQLAETQISGAIESGDLNELRNLCLRYSFLPAASKGYELLVRVSVDRGDFQEAALILGRLERMAQLNKVPPTAQRTAMLAVCFAKAGLTEDARDTLKRLTPDATTAAFRLPDVTKDVEVDAWLRQFASGPESRFTWEQPGGNYRRSSQQWRTPPSLKPLWSSSSFTVNDVMFADQYNPLLTQIGRELETELLRMLPENQIFVPTPQPLVHGDLVIVRTPFGVRAVRRTSGELAWDVTRPDNVVRTMLDRRTDAANRPDEDNVLSYIMYMEPWRLFFNNLIRTNTASQMSISGRTLFVIDDCYEAASNDAGQFAFSATENQLIPSNLIRAYDVESGLFLWEIGGKTQVNAMPAGKGNLLSGFYFLGAPLVLGERTYVLAESGEGIFLIQIQAPARESGRVNPSIARAQILTVPKAKLPSHPVRSHAGLMPSFAQGLLICPTCDERIVAVSAEDHSLRWVFRYGANIRTQELGGDANVLFGGRDFFDSGRVDLASRWIDSFPRIVNDRVIVSPRDSDQMYCLDLATGREIWKIARSGFHGIATVTSDSVVLIGNEQVASFRLENGRQIWSTAITDGIVLGTASSNGKLLQVPVSDPAVLTFDLANGNLLVRQPLPVSGTVGNLLAMPDGTLMQSLTSVTFFEPSSAEPTFADRVTEQLLNGRLEDAITLLEKESASQPMTAELRSLMMEVMLRALKSDFAKYRTLLPKVRSLIDGNENDIDIASVVHSLVGMNLPDVPVSAKLLEGNGRRFHDIMLELEAQEIRESNGLSVDQFVKSLEYEIRRLPDGRSESSSFGFLHRSRASVMVASMRRALLERPAAERRQIAVQLQKVAEDTLAGIGSEKEQVQFAMDLMSCGLYETVLPMVASAGSSKLAPRATALREQVRLQMILDNADTATAADDLLTEWTATSQLDAARSFLVDAGAEPVPGSNLRYQLTDADMRRTVLEKWSEQTKSTVKPSAWSETPVVSESDDRTMLPTSKPPSTIPDQNVPLYGPPGVFRDWSFVRNSSLAPGSGEI